MRRCDTKACKHKYSRQDHTHSTFQGRDPEVPSIHVSHQVDGQPRVNLPGKAAALAADATGLTLGVALSTTAPWWELPTAPPCFTGT
jgi:hypothetical protein